MKRNLKIIIPVIIAIILIATGIILSFSSNKDEVDTTKKLTQQEAEDYVKKLNELIIYGGSSKDLIAALQVDELLNTDIMTGEDMYLRQQPTDSISTDKSCKKYIETSEKVSKNLETAIQENFSFNIEGTAVEEGYLAVLVTYKNYSYNAYLNDLSAIINQLLILKGYKIAEDSFKETDEFLIDLYKAKIKAATILDSHLDDYKNEETSAPIYIYFNDNMIKGNSDSFVSYFINLQGYTHENQGLLTTEEKINNYIGNLTADNCLDL